jgi:hypothetical protein
MFAAVLRNDHTTIARLDGRIGYPLHFVTQHQGQWSVISVDAINGNGLDGLFNGQYPIAFGL